MDKRNVALFGCGTVGMGVAQALLNRGALGERIGDAVQLKYIVDARLEELRRTLELPDTVVLTDDLAAALGDPDIHIVVELFGGTTAARDVLERGLRSGKDVVTANKALLAEHGDELFRVAREQGRCIAFEASVCGAIPVIGAIRDGLIGDDIESIHGIVNGTCNYILTRMLGAGLCYADALAEAQAKGYAEADPGLDVGGVDSAHKLTVLARLAFGVNVHLEDVPCEGITGVGLQDLEYARSLGYALKLLAIGIRRGERIELRVHPALLRRDHPLANVGDVFNAVCIRASHAGEVILTGKGAGQMPTTSAIVGDIARVAIGNYQKTFASLAQFGEAPAARVVPFGEIETRYYFRLDCLDRAGVLAQVAGILGEEGISMASVRQQEVADDGEFVPVVFMTHRARESAVRRALDRINQLDVVRGGTTCVLRVEDM